MTYNTKRSMLQENNPVTACMSVSLISVCTLIGTYLVCCVVQGRGDCAVLCSRYS